MRINWKETCKFLSGAFFVSAGVLFYLYLSNTSVPLVGTDIVAGPNLHFFRSVIHALLFCATFYFGFVRK